ncbi:EamA family transporter [Amaricoccus tamworthensis]|uniref:EamA family transporter n=1 Tax=Amaricoccus tamworthensis TaxID=57002 RepID=UPI003C7D2F45
METWALLAVGAAFMQNVRSALQKTLTGRVSVLGAAYARFIFAAPWAVLLFIGFSLVRGLGVPDMSASFFLWMPLGGLCQISATLLLLHLFTLRNFAAGNTFMKTETVQAVLIGLVLLGDRVSPAAMTGIVVSLVGVLLLSRTSGLAGGIWSRATGVGLACGAIFALSGVAYRAAGLALEGDGGSFHHAAFTLACVTVLQTVVMTLYMRRRSPGEVGNVLGQWRIALPVGVSGMLASFCWFSAFALISAAHVKAVGQIELLFSYLTSRIVFGEKPGLVETIGMILVAVGIVVLVLNP